MAEETATPVTYEKSWLAWIVCLSAGLFFFYEFIQMNMLNSLGTYLVKDYSINATALGNLSAWYFYANLIFLLTAGLILDRISTRKVILFAMIMCVGGTLLFAFSNSLLLAAVCRFVTGIGSAFCFLSCIRLASRWFPPQRMASITGAVVTLAMLGGMVAQTPLMLLAQMLGWRHALFVDVGLGIVIIAMVLTFVRDYPEGYHAHHHAEQRELQGIGFWRAQGLAFLRVQNWLAGFYTCFLNLPVSLLGALWGNTYLQQVRHLTSQQASFVTSMIFFGIVLGSPTVGWISDRVGLRRLPMLVGGCLGLLIMLAIIFLQSLSLPVLLVLFFLLGLVTSTQIISYPTVAESNTKLLTATSVSVVSICAIGGYAVFQPLFGRLMDWHWQTHAGVMGADAVRVYSAGDYQFAIMIMPIAFAIGLVAASLLKETYCRARQD